MLPSDMQDPDSNLPSDWNIADCDMISGQDQMDTDGQEIVPSSAMVIYAVGDSSQGQVSEPSVLVQVSEATADHRSLIQVSHSPIDVVAPMALSSMVKFDVAKLSSSLSVRNVPSFMRELTSPSDSLELGEVADDGP